MPILDLEEPGRFSGEHASGMFDRMGTDIRERWGSIKEDQASYRLGEILMEESLLRTGGNVIGGAGDLIMEGAMTFLKEGASDEENRLMTQAFKRIMESGPAKATLEKIQSWAQENPRLAKDLFAAVDVAAVVPGVKVARGMFRELGQATPTVFGKQAYGGGRFGMPVETANQVLRALPGTVKRTFNPKDIATKRAVGGIDPNRLGQDVLKKEGAASVKMTNTQQKMLNKPPPGKSVELSNLYGTVRAKDRQSVSDHLFKKGKNIEFEVPEQVQKRALQHLYDVWKVKNTDNVEIRRGGGGRGGLTQEAVGTTSIGPTVLRNLMSQKHLDNYSKQALGKEVSDLTTEDLIRFMETSVLRTGDLKTLPYSKLQISHLNFLKVENGLKGGQPLSSFSAQQRKNFLDVNQILSKRGTLNIKRGGKGDDHLYISTSPHSAAKELGGVTDFIAINPKTGDFYTMISDRTDLLGVGLPGGRGSVTAMPIQKGNFHTRTYGEKIGAGHKPRDKPGELALSDDLVRRTGIPRGPNQSAASHEVAVLNQLAQEGATPEPQDFLTALRRSAWTGAAGTPLIQEGGLFEGSY